LSGRIYNPGFPDFFFIVKIILDNSKLPDFVIDIFEARKYAYKETGELVYDCDNCTVPEKYKIMVGCPLIDAPPAGDNCQFERCPGFALSSEFVSEIYEMIQMIESLPLINLYNHSNILYEVALLEYAYNNWQRREQLKKLKEQ